MTIGPTVPQLFTQWWLYWHNADPLKFPLPSVLGSSLSEQMVVFLSRGALDPEVDTATEFIWETYQSSIEIMLLIYHMRPKDRNRIPHPLPSTTSAYEFMNSNPNITEADKEIVRFVIEYGTRLRSTGEEEFLFNHNTPTPSPATLV